MHKLILLLLSFFTYNSFAQSFYERFQNLYNADDTTDLKLLFEEWRKSSPNDPELYTSEFNYYLSKSKQEVLSIVNAPQGEDDIVIEDSLGNVKGYLGSRIMFDDKSFDKAISVLEEGIVKFPNRLDMRHGRTYAFGEKGDYNNFTKSLIQTLEYSTINKNQWLWMKDKPLDNPEEILLKSVQSYLVQLYETGDDLLLPNMIDIGEKTLQYYPNRIEVLSTTAIAYLLTNNLDKGLEYLKRAEQLDPTDFIVLYNIARAYKLQGDKNNAIKYYELSIKHGDERAKEEAERNIQELKNQ